jgi:uncharacterized repeat protein (TIGR03803 family)
MNARNRIWIALGLALGCLGASASPGTALTYSKLYTFCTGATCTDGQSPSSPLLKSGNKLYGTTSSGGSHNGGVLFQYNTNTGNYKVLWNFCTTSGCPNAPGGNLIKDTSGNLYGTTAAGGANGGGAVYELIKPASGAWTFSTLYSFCATMSGSTCTDGKGPHGLSYAGAAGGSDYDGSSLLFGFTSSGGSTSNKGAVYALQLSGGTWSEKVLHGFAGGTSDGAGPVGSPWIDGSNNIFGTTSSGGSQGKGTAFELTPGMNLWTDPWTETILYNFCWQGIAKCTDGNTPNGIILDGSGNIWGTTFMGGNGSGTFGNGLLYMLDAGSSCTEGGTATFWCETPLWAFCNVSTCPDGYLPNSTVAMDGSGNVYGTTLLGGTGAGGFPGAGTTFEYTGGVVNTIHDFCHFGNCPDGQSPIDVTLDAAGDVFGATSSGGDATSQAGVLYELTNP